MTSLPPFLTPDPDDEARALALDALIFGPVEADARARAEVSDNETPPLRAYLLLDASASPDIAICLEGFSDPARCLFDGQPREDLAEVAPWLAQPSRHGAVWDWFIDEGWGNNWGIILHSRLEPARLKTRLKAWLRVTDEAGAVFFFKYYRPSHLNDYLPVLDNRQRESFFRGIEAFFAEDARDANVLVRLGLDDDGALIRAPHDLLATGRPLRPALADAAEATRLIAAAMRGDG